MGLERELRDRISDGRFRVERIPETPTGNTSYDIMTRGNRVLGRLDIITVTEQDVTRILEMRYEGRIPGHEFREFEDDHLSLEAVDLPEWVLDTTRLGYDNHVPNNTPQQPLFRTDMHTAIAFANAERFMKARSSDYHKQVHTYVE